MLGRSGDCWPSSRTSSRLDGWSGVSAVTGSGSSLPVAALREITESPSWMFSMATSPRLVCTGVREAKQDGDGSRYPTLSAQNAERMGHLQLIGGSRVGPPAILEVALGVDSSDAFNWRMNASVSVRASLLEMHTL